MYLKSLTMKGFKSFADPTTLDFEPGVTVVVGPNGSGKSNVVDAIAWVLGAQGPSIVRSAKMDDVIFAGTADRAALGRAEVLLVIDNASRRLPADLNEVTIRRTIFRNGDSEYALNGVECRLLDVQELLSDGGIGRQQHSIISQGQLDSILSARPEDRRVAIEEAAGILKYRRRRERAVRRLEGAEASLVRLGDLLREVRRQVRPLERQAASAERHAELATELRSVALALGASEIRAMRLDKAEASASLKRLAERAQERASRRETLALSITEAEARMSADPADRLVPLRARTDRLEERTRGLAAVLQARERSRSALALALDEAAGVASLTDTRDRLRTELEGTGAVAERLALEWSTLALDESKLIEQEAAHADAFADLSGGALETAAVKRAEIARRIEARDVAARQRATTAERLDSLRARREHFTERLAAAAAALEALAPALITARAGLDGLETAVALADAARTRTERELATTRESRAGLAARTEALDLALSEVRSRAGAERLGSLSGVLGSLVDLVEVDPPVSLAFEAAVHAALDATVCADEATARAAVAALRAAAEPGSVLLADINVGSAGRPSLGGGAFWLADRVRGRRGNLAGVLDRLIGGVAVVDGDLDAALNCLARSDVATVVTPEGDVYSRHGWRIGAGRSGATLDALERANDELAAIGELLADREAADGAARAAIEVARAALRGAESRVLQLEREHRQAESERGETAALLAVLTEEEAAAAEALREEDTLRAELDAELTTERTALGEAESAAEIEQARAAAARSARTDLDDRAKALSALRRDLEVRSAALEERRGQLEARVGELSAEIDRRNFAIVDAGARRDALEQERTAVTGLVAELETARSALFATKARVDAAFEGRRANAATELGRITLWRNERDALEAETERARNERQRVEIELAQLEVREEGAIDTLRRELDVSPEEALAAGPVDLPEGVTVVERRAQLDREIRELGPVNLLAKEELDALVERSTFLESQIEDANSARRELNGVIRAVDAEIADVFAAAFADVSRNFELLVTALFPGGTGRLSLTAPDDLLETGVEIEARPAGRTIRRLSLLSGGERSLVALAFLFSIFRSRPSPFYLMDEVEAALDDVNLVRFLALLEEFREEAQLLVVSHQKRTMEIADSLYGVTMQPGGASKVVSERLAPRRATSAPGRPN
ncbi:MAG TPA: chromosome segregation protein SMC [Acidimicrobiales bacterium]|nr:chromosome segregation protein SMC [Acidimicrobiales bacterium]